MNQSAHPPSADSATTLHVAVMTQEVMEALKPRSGGSYIDATLGGGTHTSELLSGSYPDGRVLSLDVDPKAISRSRQQFAEYEKRWVGVETNFRHIADAAKEHGFDDCQGIIIDLGFSSDELADSAKGLSFLRDGPLDMRFGPRANEDGLTAADIVNSWSYDELEHIIRELGEERFARRIADAIVTARRHARLVGTLDLASVIRSAVPRLYERGRIHPATRTFQALRMTVNDELGAIRDAIEGAKKILAQGGRIAVISFHSLEDRVVKQAFKTADDLEVITKKPKTPSQKEIEQNQRARSAKLRVAEKTESKIQNNKNKYVSKFRPSHDATT
jgi:16S rRNA (cytosine1402-N4)-methyltransferase